MAKKALLPRVFQRVDRFLTVGDANEAYYRHFGVPDCKLIRSFFPIDIKAYDVAVADNTAQRARLRARLAIPDAHTVLLMVGKFVPWKRQEDLIRFSNSQGSDAFTVVLAGSGGLEDHLRRTARRVGPGGVIFAGFVPPEDLPQYYLAADLYTHCAEHEPHSLAVSEAIYCGLPAIVSDRSGSYGPTDDVRVGENGFVYRCGNVPALTSYIKVIRAAPKLMDSMKQASLEISRANQRLAHGRVLRHLLDSLAVNLQS
jgi:glycosyltransferase involved in cell wall biosynthesis